MITIKTWRDPYDACFTPTRPKKIEIQPGLTVLVGCNGAGKTTLIHNICDEIKASNKHDKEAPIIPVHCYDNLKSGGNNALSGALFRQDYSTLASLACDSEGEAIKENFGSFISSFQKFLNSGYFDVDSNKFARIFCDKDDEEESLSNKRVVLFDAIDSGLSVDSVVEIREIFNLMMEDASKKGIELYIVASANEYEMARNANCFDVNDGKYVEIKDYESYRSFILKSRKKKEARIKKQSEKLAKKQEKEEARKLVAIEKCNKKIEKIESKARQANRELTRMEKYDIENIRHTIHQIEKYGADEY